MSQTSDYTYQLNAYFGIFYPDDLISIVLDLCKTYTRFAPLGDDVAEVSAGKASTLFASTNSDIDGECTVGFIAADEMTLGGPDEEAPEDTTVRIDPGEMEKRETKNKIAVDALTDLYELLIKDFKARQIPVNKLYLGWQVVSCTWDLDESESSAEGSSSEEAPAPSARGKKASAQPKTATQPKPSAQPKATDQPKTPAVRGGRTAAQPKARTAQQTAGTNETKSEPKAEVAAETPVRGGRGRGKK